MLTRREFTRELAAAVGISSLTGGAVSAAVRLAEKPDQATVRAVVLGSAQDGGLPHIGCRKEHCEAARANPALRRRSPALALLDFENQSAFLLDAGPDFPEQLADLPPDWGEHSRPLAGIFLTHAHIGHYTGLMYLGREALGAAEVPVYCSRSMAAFLTNNGPWSQLVTLKNIVINVIEPGQTIALTRNISIRPLAVPHRGEYTDTLAFIAQGPRHSLLYLPDIDRWQGLEPSIESLVTSVDIALLDGTFYSDDELPNRNLAEIPHPRVEESARRLRHLVGPGKPRVVFIHLNHSNLLLDADGKRLEALCGQGFDIAEDGTTFEL